MQPLRLIFRLFAGGVETGGNDAPIAQKVRRRL